MRSPNLITLINFARKHQEFVTDCNAQILRGIEPGKLTLIYHLVVISELAETADQLWDFQCTVQGTKQGVIVHPQDKYSRIVWRNVELILNNKHMDGIYEHNEHTLGSGIRTEPRNGSCIAEYSGQGNQRLQ